MRTKDTMHYSILQSATICLMLQQLKYHVSVIKPEVYLWLWSDSTLVKEGFAPHSVGWIYIVLHTASR